MSATVAVDVHLAAPDWADVLAAEVRDGLTGSPKVLSPVWFYDERGSELFDEITRLDEYYPTRAERAILEAHAGTSPAAPVPRRWSSSARARRTRPGSCSTPWPRPAPSSASCHST